MNHRVGVGILLVGCNVVGCNAGAPPDAEPELAGPLGIPLVADGVTYVGAARVDITPAVGERYDDLNGNGLFDGCLDDPDCEEPFEDLDGDGLFEPVWIGGFGYLRPALDVRADDGIDARAMIISRDEGYVVMVGLDLVGITHTRIDQMKEQLRADGLDPARLVVASTHNHQGPDTMGLWGDPLAGVSGFDEVYQDRVVEGVVAAVREAAALMRPGDLRVGSVHMRDRDPYFSGSTFGGRNPTDKMHGMVHDIRDPVLVSDQLLVLQATDDVGDVVFTLTNWSGHPEVRGGDNSELSSDWVGVTRRILEDRYGGVAVHLPECLGGMQSALGGDLPLVQDDGEHVFETCTAEDIADEADEGCAGRAVGETRVDDDGAPVPVWAPRDSWQFVISHGWHIAEAAIAALDAGEPLDAAPIRAVSTRSYVPIRNLAYDLLGPQGIFDVGMDSAITDASLCPGAAEVNIGCLPFDTGRVQIGEVGFVLAPGELLPELAWGVPDDDPTWVLESRDPTARGPGSTYFPQHDPDCNDIDPQDCLEVDSIGDCDCLSIHAWPYSLSPDPSHGPVLDALGTRYVATIGMASTYLSYIVPEPSVNRRVSLLSDRVGDHYEDTVTPAWDFGTLFLDAQASLDADW